MKNEATDLWPGQSAPLLKALHILTQNGGLNADSRRKLKQVLHLAQLIKPAIDDVLKEKDQPVLADLGAGKSYLGFILYDLYFRAGGRGKVIAVEARADLIKTGKKIAEDSGFDGMDFVEGKIADAEAWQKGNRAAVRVVPKKTGAYFIVFSIEQSRAKKNRWALAYGYR